MECIAIKFKYFPRKSKCKMKILDWIAALLMQEKQTWKIVILGKGTLGALKNDLIDYGWSLVDMIEKKKRFNVLYAF